MSSDDKIVIDLEESSNAQFFKTTALIHKREFDTVTSWIDQSLEKLEKLKKRALSEKEILDNVRLHETITILGSRGSGKTTFLISLLKTYKDNTASGVEVFNIIDPTLFEEKGHIFLDIISRIKSLVDDKLDQSETNPLSSDYLRRKDWNENLKKLAHGLPLLDGVGGQMTEPAWQDAEFIMNNGIQAVTSARNLELNFHRLINEALAILGKKAFLIAFDDIDIDFIKGWRVMETIRKYFTSPQIITLMSGDLKLYSKSIRKHQWKNFGKALLMNEAETLGKMDDFRELVTKMESQYMQKVMKPERRIHLNTISERINIEESREDRFKICVKSNNENKEIEIRDFYNDRLKKFGINKIYVAATYSSFLLGLPLRTQIQFLSSIDKLSKNSKEDKDNSKKDEYYPANILDPFYSDLLERQVDISLAVSTPKMLNVVILNFLLKEKIIDEGYQVQPTITDISISSCLTALSLYYSQTVKKNGYVIFDYLIKVGYTRNLFTSLGYQKSSDSLSPSVEGLYKFSHIHIDKVLRDTVANMTAYMRAFLDIKEENRKPWGGTIPLPNRALNPLEKNRIDSIFSNKTLVKRNLASIPLSICKHPQTNETIPTYSIYALLATAGEFLKAGVLPHAAFMEQSQVRTHIMPEFKASYEIKKAPINIPANETELDLSIAKSNNQEHFDPETKKKIEEEEELNKLIQEEELKNLMEYIKDWVKNYKLMTKEIPPYVLGKASTRAFYALNNIESNNESFGKMVNDRIIAFLNAILIEDVKEYVDDSSGLNVNSQNSDNTIFHANLIFGKKDKIFQQLKFSRWMLSCPLFLCYLEPDNVVKLHEFTDEPFADPIKIKTISIYDLLGKVSLDGINIQTPK